MAKNYTLGETSYGHCFENFGKLYFMFGSPQEAELLSSFVLEINQNKCTIVEVGTGHGGSAVVFARSLNDGTVYTIDIGIPPIKFTDTRIKFINKLSVEAAKDFKNNSCDLVYLDASHTYENVIGDLTVWFPKVCKGGIFCGHDCIERFDRFTVQQQEQLRENQSSEVWVVSEPQKWNVLRKQYNKSLKWGTPFTIHPGVICAVHDFFKGNYTLFPNTSIWRAN
jgi:hypothetical protein